MRNRRRRSAAGEAPATAVTSVVTPTSSCSRSGSGGHRGRSPRRSRSEPAVEPAARDALAGSGSEREEEVQMSTTTAVSRVFPSPYEIETPPGCEGWEELYPYYALFEESRRENDEARLWFWNSMHFPLPMPAFDGAMIDSPYQAVGAWQNRVFAVPPVMGIDYRAVNGYIYISANPVTDAAQIAERAEFFQRRAGYYYENWDELYERWQWKMGGRRADLG